MIIILYSYANTPAYHQLPGIMGDGIVMAQAVGADLVDIDQIRLHPAPETEAAEEAAEEPAEEEAVPNAA